MDIKPEETLDETKITAFMEELKKLTVKYGIVLEACECGGGMEPTLAPNHILEGDLWQYIRTPEEIGGHYQYSPTNAYDEPPEGVQYIEVNFDVDERLN